MAIWLAWSVIAVNIEFDDGYATIANSQYLLGLSDYYFWQRGPLMAILLLPAELLATTLDLHPLDVRPHHAMMAAVHWLAFAGAWVLLRRQFGERGGVLLAFVAALPTVVFFSYAPFISHDIIPGVVAVLMLKWARDYSLAPGTGLWCAVLIAGVVLALIKQTYAVVWIAVLIANAVVDVLEGTGRRQVLATLSKLLAAAGAGAAITWCLYGYVLAGSFPETPLLHRPWRQIELILTVYEGRGPIRNEFYQWVYLRNLSAYGMLAMALAAPGIYLSLTRGDGFQKRVAIAWPVLFLLLNAITFKEVRYLAFLAPLTAILIVPAIDELLRLNRRFAIALGIVLLFDLSGATTEALRLRDPYYRNAVIGFLGPLPNRDAEGPPILMSWTLSFVSPDRYAFFADRFHRITHITSQQLQQLYRYRARRVRDVPDARALNGMSIAPGTWLIFVNDVAARAPPFRADNKTALNDYFLQLLAQAEPIKLMRVGTDYRFENPTGELVMLLPNRGIAASPILSASVFSATSMQQLLGQSSLPDQLELTGFRVHRQCNISGCALPATPKPPLVANP